MKLFAILVLIATCLAVVTEAQQTTLKPSTTKTTTPVIKVTTTTRKPIAVTGIATTTVKTTTVKTTLKPTVTTTTSKPTTTTTTSKPTTKTTTTTQPTTTTTTTTKPTTTTTTTSKPTTTTSKPTTTTTTTKPTTTSKPTTTTTTTTKPTTTTTTTTTKPTTTTTTTSKPTTTTTTTTKPTTTTTTTKPETTTTTTSKPTTTTTTTAKPTTTTTTTTKPTTTTTTTTKPTTTTTTTKPETTTTTTSKPTTTTTTTTQPTTTTTTTAKPTTTTTTTSKPTTTTTTITKPTTTTTTTKPTTTTTTTSKPTTTKTTTTEPTTTTITTAKPTTTTTTTSKPIITTTITSQPPTTPTTSTTTTLKPSVSSTTLMTTTTSTLRETTVKTTTLKPTVTSTTLKQTDTFNTLGPDRITSSNPTNTTTAAEQDVSTTTLNPSTKTEFFVCRDAYSTDPSGTVQPDPNSTNNNCSFNIIAPSDQQIQIFCSSLNFTAATSPSLKINGDLDNSWQIVPNRIYYSVGNNLSLIFSKFNYNNEVNTDSFHCNWTTSPKEITTESKLCRHAETNAANGTIQPMAGDDDWTERSCSFLIKALPDQQIQISCSAVNFTSNSSSTFLSIDGTLDELQPYSPVKPPSNKRFIIYSNWNHPVLNRTYYSSSNNLTISSAFSKQDSFLCNWTTVPKEITTNSKLCRHSQSSMDSGTIQPLASDGGPPRTCFFPISVLPGQRIQISCSDLNLTNQNGNINFQGITEVIPYYPGPVLNRVYYSVDNNVYVSSRFSNDNSFTCNWTAIPKENTTNLQFCRHGLASMTNGTIEPFSEIETGQTSECLFTITATPDYQIQLSCSDLNLTTQFSYTSLGIKGVADDYVMNPVANRIYYSSAENRVTLTAKVSNTDRFLCNWTIVPREVTADNKLCQNTVATTTSGTIQPSMIGDAEPTRQCTFVISSRSNEQIQISCSNVSVGSPLTFTGIAEYYVAPPQVNRIYTSQKYYNTIRISSKMSGNSTDNWFDCKWTITPRENTTENKLCLNTEATTPNGTLQPIAGDTGSPRQCYFSVSALPNQKIQISCSVVNLTSASYFRIYGTTNMDFPPVVNRVYTSYSYNSIMISSQLGDGDWIDCKWTTTPRTSTPDAQLCSDIQATTANGTIQPMEGDTGPPRWCSFSISAPSNKQIQISCSVLNLTSNSSYLRMSGALGGDNIQPVLNQVYYSTASNYIYMYSLLGYGDWINCNWVTVPEEITSESKLCRHSEATTANGTIQPIVGNNTGQPKKCSFTISAPNEQQIQISCSPVQLTDPSSTFLISGVIDYVYPAPVANRVYTSPYHQIFIDSQLGSEDWVSCNWTTTPKRNTSENKLCQNSFATTAIGTIEPLAGDNGPPRSCYFVINAAPENQIQISCTNVTLNTTAGSQVTFSGVVGNSPQTIANRVYYSSTSSNQIYITTQIGNGDWMSCNWTTIPRENTTEPKFCRDEKTTSANGTIQFSGDTGPPRDCPLTITAPSNDQQIQIICSAINLTDATRSFKIFGAIDFYVSPPVVNRVYTSAYGTIYISSQLGDGDWIDCKWTTIPKNTTDNKLCQNNVATSASGTIQPIAGDMGPPRNCYFSISAFDGQQIQMACSAVNLNSSGSSFQIYGTIDYASPPIVNRVYTSASSSIYISSQLGDGDWIDCKWTTTWMNTTDNKLCLNSVATSTNGTIQPIAGDTGPPRNCYFSINVPSDQQTQISCPVASLVAPNSYFQISGVIDSVYPAPVANRVYTSSSYNQIYINSRLSNEDWISCNWTTTPRDNTTNYKLCQHSQATTKSGSIQSLEGDTGPSRSCSFYINPVSDEQYQISCSNVTLNTTAGSYLSFYGGVDYVSPPLVNRRYISKKYYQTQIYSQLSSDDWISCNWTTIVPRANTSTEFQFCLDEQTFSANGSIQPLAGDMGPPRFCRFTIAAPYEQQIQISCSAVNFTYASSSLKISESIDGDWANPPTLNRVYTSSSNLIILTSFLGGGDWIYCNWTTFPKQNNYTDNKVCLNAETTATTGTLQPLSGDTEPMRQCPFYVKSLPGQQIQISCSIDNLSSSSFLSISGVVDNPETQLTANRIYYLSSDGNFITLIARIKNTDWFTCNWTTVSRENTTNNQLCRHRVATTDIGTLQPISGDTALSQRTCPFSVIAFNDQRIQFSCSAINLTISSSFLTLTGVIDSDWIINPVVNRVYYSTGSSITTNSRLGNEDWINCNWTITPKENTTNYKLCQHYATSSSYGTIQPIGGDPGPSRQCGFSIYVYSSIQISCSTVNLVNAGSYLQIGNIYGSLNYNPPTENTTYTFSYGNIQLSSKIGDGDWFDCKWELSP